MALDNVLAIFLLPVCGMLSDKDEAWQKNAIYRGRYDPRSDLQVMMLPMIDNAEKARWATGGSFSNCVFFLGVLFLTLVSMGLYRSPAVALMPDDAEPSAQLNAVINGGEP